MNRRLKLILAAALTAAALCAAGQILAQNARDLEAQLIAAERRAEIEGDLPGAIADLKKIVETKGVDSALAAKALLAMADSYVRMRDDEARKIYEQIVKDYADQKEAVATARAWLERVGKAGNTWIEGVVAKLGTNEPLSGVDVQLTRVEGTPSAPLTAAAPPPRAGARGVAQPAAQSPQPAFEVLPPVKTVNNGTFAFRDLKPGKYVLTAKSADGAYNPAEYGQRDPRGRGFAFPLAGQPMRNVKLEMAPTSTITGRVIDEKGAPVGHARVLALEPQYKEGRRVWSIAQVVYSDERGNYRLFQLAPGRYAVAAKLEDPRFTPDERYIVPPGTPPVYAHAGAPLITRRVQPTGEVVEETYGIAYYGGGSDASKAQMIDLRPGTNAVADVSMGQPIRTRHIRGVIVATGTAGGRANAAAPANLPRRIRAVSSGINPDLFVIQGVADATGSFDIGGIIPGAYTIMTDGAGGAAFLEVVVGDADLDGQKIPYTPGGAYPGNVMIEGKASNDLDLARIRVALLPEFILGGIISPGQQSSPPATVSADGSFRYQGRRYNRVRVDGLPPAGYVKSLQVGANDLLNGDSRIVALGPMTIVVAVDGGTVNGVVVDNGKKAMANAVVALAPSSPELRRRPDLYRSTTTDFDGRFQLQGVPGGDYKLFVWEYAPEGAWQNAEFLQNYERFGQTIRVTPGGNQNVTVTVIPPQR